MTAHITGITMTEEPCYPMDTIEHAKRSRLRALFEYHEGWMTEQTYRIIRHRLDARIAELEMKANRHGR